jgi:hypothetical protein
MLVLLLGLAWYWHGVHMSTAVVDYRSDSRNVEVMITVSADHLEEILSRRAGSSLEIDRAPEAQKLAAAYVLERFVLRDGAGKTLPLRWVGWEIKGGSVNCFVEAKASPDTNLRLKNDLLLDWQKDQVNRVLPKRDGKGKPPQLVFWSGTLGEFQNLSF